MTFGHDAMKLGLKDEMRHYSERLAIKWGSLVHLPPPLPCDWCPKNPEIIIPVSSDISMTDTEWATSNFPYNPIPSSITTHVNTDKWRALTVEAASDPNRSREADLLNQVLSDLTDGADSMVGCPGTCPTVTPN